RSVRSLDPDIGDDGHEIARVADYSVPHSWAGLRARRGVRPAHALYFQARAPEALAAHDAGGGGIDCDLVSLGAAVLGREACAIGPLELMSVVDGGLHLHVYVPYLVSRVHGEEAQADERDISPEGELESLVFCERAVGPIADAGNVDRLSR